MGNACDGKPIASQSLSVQAAHKLKKSVADLCLHISVDGVDADVKFGYEAIRDGWTMLTSDPNIEKAQYQGRTMVKVCCIDTDNYWVLRRPVLYSIAAPRPSRATAR